MRPDYYFGPSGVWKNFIRTPSLWDLSFTKRLLKVAYQAYTALASSAKEERAMPSSLRASDGTMLHRHRGSMRNYFEAGYYEEIEARVRRLIEYLKSIGAVPVVALFPSKEATYKAEYARLFPKTLTYLDVERRGYQRIVDLAARHAVQSINLGQAFQAARAKGETLYFELDPHWTPAGHGLAAQALSVEIKELLDN